MSVAHASNAGSNVVSESPLILFDGRCGLCNGWIDFVLRYDRGGRFRFTPLQSETGGEILDRFQFPRDYLGSIVLWENGRIYTNSTAVLRILRGLGFPFSLGYAFVVIPRLIRDAVYRFIARNRYSWFGQRASCRMPTPEERARFV